LFDIEREIKDTKVRLCLDCGKCTAVCPVAQYDPEFNPRLIIQRRLASKNHGRDDTIWECLNCHMCFERCNYHVKFPEFVCALRSEALQEGGQVQCSHGGALQSLMRIMTHKGLRQERLDWLPDNVILTGQSDTQFFVGCAPYFDVLFSDIGVKTLDGVAGALKLLNLAQIPFNISAGERCCGRDLLLQGDREGFKMLARANLDDFSRRGVKRLITNCPECYYTLKVDYPLVMGNAGVEVIHLMEVIAPLVQDKKLNLGSLNKRVTYQDPCTLGRGLRIFDAPRQVLGAVAGLVEMEQSRETALCCGASPWVHCGSVNRQIQEKRLAQAKAVGADILVTACPKCQIHLKCTQKCNPVLSTGQVSYIEIQDLAFVVARSVSDGQEVSQIG